jgi:hypothetical protein
VRDQRKELVRMEPGRREVVPDRSAAAHLPAAETRAILGVSRRVSRSARPRSARPRGAPCVSTNPSCLQARPLGHVWSDRLAARADQGEASCC